MGAGRRVPFSRRVAIDGDAFRKIIAQMWIVVPQEIKRAQEFELERDRLIARAQEEAERLIAQAREDAARLLDEHDIRRQAEQQAEMLLKHAEEQAARIRADADEYAARTLRELADQVEYLRRVIANGISVLEAHRREQLAIAQGEQPGEETDSTAEEALTPIAEPPEKAADEAD